MIAALALGMASLAARVDPVLDWNKTAIEAVVAAKQPPPLTIRGMAIVHAAMFDG